MEIDRRETALVFTDPQNEVLSETGKAWPLVRASPAVINAIENRDRLSAAAKKHEFEVFITPHYFYPTDTILRDAILTHPTMAEGLGALFAAVPAPALTAARK
jgi:hypothetical protein